MTDEWKEKWEVIREVGKSQDNFARQILDKIVAWETLSGMKVSGIDVSRVSYSLTVKIHFDQHVTTGSAYKYLDVPSKIGVVKVSGV